MYAPKADTSIPLAAASKMKKSLFYLLLIFATTSNCSTSVRKSMNLAEDDNIRIKLIYLENADLGKSDWLKITIENKSEKNLFIESASYSINQEKTNKNGEKYIDSGEFGQSNKHDLIHEFYDIKDYLHRRDKVRIDPKSKITSWKYLTNYASVLIDGRNLDENKIIALFELKFEYQIEGKTFEVHCENKPFEFYWTHSSKIKSSDLVRRLEEILHNPHLRSVNTYVTNKLMQIDKVRESILTKDLIQAVVKRENSHNKDENILFLSELKLRNQIPNEEITTSFERRFTKHKSNAEELRYYWDDKLLPLILNDRNSHLKYSILELNSEYWLPSEENRNRIYNSLVKWKGFSFPKIIEKDNFIQWSKDVKLISIARNPKFEEYLKTHLDNKTTFEIEDWTKYQHYGVLPKGAKPDIIKVRICDIALVALLRNMNQIQFKRSSRIGTKTYSMKIKDEILDQKTIKEFDKINSLKNLELHLFEREIKMTPIINKRIAAANSR